MNTLRNGTPFYEGSERWLHSEPSFASMEESLFMGSEGEHVRCGNCRICMPIKTRPTVCVNDECQTVWQQLILSAEQPYDESTWLPTFGQLAIRGGIPMQQAAPGYAPSHDYRRTTTLALSPDQDYI